MADAIKDLPSIFGWKPPICYDIGTDGYRPVTQDDVDRWVALERTYMEMVRFLRSAHEQLRMEIARKNDG